MVVIAWRIGAARSDHCERIGVLFGETPMPNEVDVCGESAKERTLSHSVLVAGDWVVDDNWVIGTHRSPTSTRTGSGHYRSLHRLNSSVQSFCGAGRTASLLFNAETATTNIASIVGLGVWHPKDEPIIRNMFDARTTQGNTPFLLHIPDSKGGVPLEEVSLINLAKCPCVYADNQYATTRVFRFYQLTGSKINQLHRIDWELPPPPTRMSHGLPVWFPDNCTDADCTMHVCDKPELRNPDHWLRQMIEPHKDKVTAVIIKDLCKGVISLALIRVLIDCFAELPWFISTKAWKPNWLDQLKRVDLRLLVVPEMAAQMPLRYHGVPRWITRSGLPSSEALRHLKDIRERITSGSSRCHIVALPDGVSALALDHQHDEVVVQPVPFPRPVDVSTGMASACFSALITGILANPDVSLREVLESSLIFAERWMQSEAEHLKSPEEEQPREEPGILLAGASSTVSQQKGSTSLSKPNPESESLEIRSRMRIFSEKEMADDWKAAFTGIGVITRDNGKKVLELQRAMNEVDGYVCCVPWKRRSVHALIKRMDSFNDRSPRQHISCMLIARPGSGKTHLVRSLAKSINAGFHQMDITQCLTKQDILDSFDSIVTAQAQDREKPLLVFIDEINATIEGQPVYDTFLAPIEEGEYVRGGKRFKFDPCMWLFAGTAAPTPGNPSSKSSDFTSRLTFPPVDLTRPSGGADSDVSLEPLEAVYLGASLIRHLFPDVRYVATGVLKMFHSVAPPDSVRALRNFIKGFTNVQYSRIVASNVPRSEQPSGIRVDFVALDGAGSAEPVEIIDPN